MIHKRKKDDTLDFIRIKDICSVENTIKRMKKWSQSRRNYMQNTYMIVDLT